MSKIIKAVVLCILLAVSLFFIAHYVLPEKNVEYDSRTKEFGLKNIGQLATQVGYFTNVQTISASRDVLGITVPFTQSRYIYSYDGVVKAGIDFEKVVATVNDEEKTITVSMPKPEIFDVTVDENSLVVYDETKNVFTPLKLNDIKESSLTMKKEAQEKAMQYGILNNAQSNAEMLITGFLASSYTQDYKIVFTVQE